MNWSLHVFWPDEEFVHIAQCRELVINGSNHWILRQSDQVSETEAMARGTKVVFVATSDRLPSHPTKRMEEPQTAVWGSSVWRADG